MDILSIDNKCNLCNICVDVCPFAALENVGDRIEVNANCRLCKICIKNCPQKAISIQEKARTVDKSKWRDFLVFAEYVDGRLHPVTIELIGKARELAAKVNMKVDVLLIGHNTKDCARNILDYGVDNVYVYDDVGLEYFRVDVYANVFKDIIDYMQPGVVLVGGTSIGRSLAPRVATRCRTGLTADCTTLDIKPNTDLVQIRPAFGGNIMAQITTTYNRPQFATVRYKVMDSAKKCTPHGSIVKRAVTEAMLSSGIIVKRIIKKDSIPSITEAEVLVVAGQGVKSQEDLSIIQSLADILGGQMASTRPMVEKGWLDYTKQIGLSGRTVKPRLIITCGVSGAIQFATCMNNSDTIVAINKDKNAPIFKIAHYGIVGDLYKVVPELTEMLRGGVDNVL